MRGKEPMLAVCKIKQLHVGSVVIMQALAGRQTVAEGVYIYMKQQ